MTNDELKQNLQSLLGDDATKEQIEKIAVISQKVDEMIADSAKQEAEYKDLLKDYATVIRKSTFKMDDPTKADEGKKEFSFDSFAQEWQSQQKK